jgi:hypothetical protein
MRTSHQRSNYPKINSLIMSRFTSKDDSFTDFDPYLCQFILLTHISPLWRIYGSNYTSLPTSRKKLA